MPLLAWLRPLQRALAALHAPLRLALSVARARSHLALEATTLARRSAAAAEASFDDLLRRLPALCQPWEARLARRPRAGRGIVVVAGGERYAALALPLLHSLRAVGCELPVEVFHLGAAELQCEAMEALREAAARLRLDVVFRDLLATHPTLCDAAGYGYAAKPLALLASAFDEVLLLDADNRLLSDPTALFECAEYARHGALFWSDMHSFDAKFVRMYDPWQVRRRPTRFDAWLQDALDKYFLSPVRAKPDFRASLRKLGVDTSAPTAESGQLLVHKSRCLRGLAAVFVMNLNTQREFVYEGLHGDKDTFHIGFRAVGAPFHLIPRQPDLGGHVGENGCFFDSCFLQRPPGADSQPMFAHFCGRHRGEKRSPNITTYMAARGRPFRSWPEDDRRGYLAGTLHPFPTTLALACKSDEYACL
ncbi:hypothetical protein AB1Y20_011161 [Prymnesium parvum]|uniref:Uncharacterized protein n=1 Tax=Prymnesium parvum TaxID=97485 RepID=A0AB34IP80_PRYPA